MCSANPSRWNRFDELHDDLARVLELPVGNAALSGVVSLLGEEVRDGGRRAVRGGIRPHALTCGCGGIDISLERGASRSVHRETRLLEWPENGAVRQRRRLGVRIALEPPVGKQLHDIRPQQLLAGVLGAYNLGLREHAGEIDRALRRAELLGIVVLCETGAHAQPSRALQGVIELKILRRHLGIEHRSDADTVQPFDRRARARASAPRSPRARRRTRRLRRRCHAEPTR